MKGGNGVREANVVTLCSKCAYQTDEAENLPRMDSALGVLLDGFAVKKCGSLRKSLSQESPLEQLVRGHPVRKK